MQGRTENPMTNNPTLLDRLELALAAAALAALQEQP